ncbi:hypothetical protein CYMTET_14645 [Cymbomonas tetramitiformis]|uniref:Uncharacterized protein n=1 Tax=Cymbomonas tetramitiformis TaxID=36881 RepID=A0AAE0LA55_9CHLO|nr:hypothetical protein CYMTET_14645 [Cymbomonas tetramitiformis]
MRGVHSNVATQWNLHQVERAITSGARMLVSTPPIAVKHTVPWWLSNDKAKNGGAPPWNPRARDASIATNVASHNDKEFSPSAESEALAQESSEILARHTLEELDAQMISLQREMESARKAIDNTEVGQIVKGITAASEGASRSERKKKKPSPSPYSVSRSSAPTSHPAPSTSPPTWRPTAASMAAAAANKAHAAELAVHQRTEESLMRKMGGQPSGTPGKTCERDNLKPGPEKAVPITRSSSAPATRPLSTAPLPSPPPASVQQRRNRQVSTPMMLQRAASPAATERLPPRSAERAFQTPAMGPAASAENTCPAPSGDQGAAGSVRNDRTAATSRAVRGSRLSSDRSKKALQAAAERGPAGGGGREKKALGGAVPRRQAHLKGCRGAEGGARWLRGTASTAKPHPPDIHADPSRRWRRASNSHRGRTPRGTQGCSDALDIAREVLDQAMGAAVAQGQTGGVWLGAWPVSILKRSLRGDQVEDGKLKRNISFAEGTKTDDQTKPRPSARGRNGSPRRHGNSTQPPAGSRGSPRVSLPHMASASAGAKASPENESVVLPELKSNEVRKTLTQKERCHDDDLRMKLLQTAGMYIGVPYCKKVHKEKDCACEGCEESGEQLYHAAQHLDSPGLVRRVMQDLEPHFHVKLGQGNQGHLFGLLKEAEVNSVEQLEPGDLIFYSGRYHRDGSKSNVDDIVHVEMFMGGATGECVLASRERSKWVRMYSTYKFESKHWELKRYHFVKINPWLQQSRAHWSRNS